TAWNAAALRRPAASTGRPAALPRGYKPKESPQCGCQSRHSSPTRQTAYAEGNGDSGKVAGAFFTPPAESGLPPKYAILTTRYGSNPTSIGATCASNHQ